MTISNVSTLHKNKKQPMSALPRMLLVTILVVSSTVAGANQTAHATLTAPGTRSIAVDYFGQPQKVAQGKFENQKNEAQQAAITALNEDEDLQNNEQVKRQTREDVIALRKNKQPAKAEVINNPSLYMSKQTSAISHYVEFDIYRASSVLFDDIDYDGFYRTFSVTFDADVYGPFDGQRARVFADLYLSRDGGPWELYFTTDAFSLLDDSSEDEFEVLTTLDAGYRTQHYDVLIDLYEVGYSDIVATISSDDVDSLFALPLESADRDIYEETISTSVGINAGSASFISLALLSFVLVSRLFTNS